MITAVLNTEGKVHEKKESLTAPVTTGTISSIHSKRRVVGIGSSSKLSGGDFKITFLTSP